MQLDIVVFPWLGLDKPCSVQRFEFVPASTAAEKHPAYANALRAATSYFFDNQRVNDPFDEGAPTKLVPVEPSVIVLENPEDASDAYAATLALFFAVLFDNSTHRYANGTNFREFHQSLSPEFDGFGRRTRAMFGSRMLGTRPSNAIEVRPVWCGEWHAPNEEVLDLSLAALTAEGSEAIRRCLSALVPATYDSDEYESDLERSLYALALERLLHRRGKTKKRDSKKGLSGRLLGETLSRVRRLSEPPEYLLRSFDPTAPAIQKILSYIREERNDFWHPERRGKRPLSHQQAVSPNLVAFRALSALILTCMADVLARPLPLGLINYVAAVEDWCDELPQMYNEEARVPIERFGRLLARYGLRTAG